MLEVTQGCLGQVLLRLRYLDVSNVSDDFTAPSKVVLDSKPSMLHVLHKCKRLEYFAARNTSFGRPCFITHARDAEQ